MRIRKMSDSCGWVSTQTFFTIVLWLNTSSLNSKPGHFKRTSRCAPAKKYLKLIS